jgi:hypothetical protein
MEELIPAGILTDASGLPSPFGVIKQSACSLSSAQFVTAPPLKINSD